MKNKFDHEDDRKKRKDQFKRKRPVYEIIYVERDGKIREIIGEHLSAPRFSYSFLVTSLPSNDDIVPMVLNRKVDLVIIDGDQFDTNIQFIKTIIRKNCILTPILFSFVDRSRAEKTRFVTNPLDAAIDKYSLFTTIKGPSLINSLIKKSMRIKEMADKMRREKENDQKGDTH